MKRRRVVVTGMGIVSAFGTDVDLFYDQLLAGKSCVSTIEKFPCSEYPTRIAGEIKQFDTEGFVERKYARRVDQFINYAIVAGKKAASHAKLTAPLEPLRAGVVIGSGMGGMAAFADGVLTIHEKGYRRLTPFFVPSIITNMAGAMLAIDLNFRGPNFSVSTACATANFAMILGAREIQENRADIVLVGGSEAAMTPIGLAGFVASRALSTQNDDPTKASKPWDKKRDGFVMGEGAAVLVLESLEHAKARNAPILAEFLGGAMNCDAYHMTEPRDTGEVVALCMEEAIRDANLSYQDINYINAHATSTLAGDLCEIKAIKKVFPHHEGLKINATKSMIGHCLGAAGAMEAVAVIKAIETHMLHPTINLEDPEEELDGLDPIRDKAKPHIVKAALSNSFGFGGHNACIIFGPYQG